MKQEREESNEASNYQGAVTCHLFLFPGEHLGNPLEAYFSYPGTRNKDVFPLSSASRYPSFRPSASHSRLPPDEARSDASFIQFPGNLVREHRLRVTLTILVKSSGAARRNAETRSRLKIK